MLIEHLRFPGIVKDSILMGAETGENHRFRAFKSDPGGMTCADLLTGSRIKGHDFPVGGLLYLSAVFASGQTPDRPR